MTDATAFHERLQALDHVTNAFIRTLEGIDASFEVTGSGLGNFASWYLVKMGSEGDQDPRPVVERWCYGVMQAAAERYKTMLALKNKTPMSEPCAPFI